MAKKATINLLREYLRDKRRDQAVVVRVQLYAGVVLAVYVAIVVGVFSIRAVYVTKFNKTQAAIASEEERIDGLSEVEGKYLVLRAKLQAIADRLATENRMRQYLKDLYQYIPAEVELVSVEVGGNASGLTLQMKAADIFMANKALASFKEAVAKQAYVRTTVSGVSREANGEYSLTISVEVNSGVVEGEE